MVTESTTNTSTEAERAASSTHLLTVAGIRATGCLSRCGRFAGVAFVGLVDRLPRRADSATSS
ncbi:MAG: hypothetical protein QOG57_834 [Pseudonocardiales bacterium]|nr:hypothetical protein [Pseudonocardiales bacterium]